MRIKQDLKLISGVILLCALALSGRAQQSFTNNFDSTFDYVANGIVGDTNWDGVYLKLGDVLGGNNGGDVNGNTTVAQANSSPPLALAVQATGGSWAAAGDDGFFIWKYVTGDFDVSVEIFGPYPAVAYQFAGLMVRLYDTNNSGAPFSLTSTNGGENQTWLARFQQFGNSVDARWTTNGNDAGDHAFDGSDTNVATGDNRFYRINRTGSTFSYYVRTNSSDAWALKTSVSLPSLVGGVQVGIMDADFTGNSAGAVFGDFELTTTNLNFPTPGAAPSALVTTATNTGGSLSFSWTLGHPGDSSLVVMQSSGNFQCNPIQGLTYAADSTFGDTNTVLGDANEFVVYNGTNTSVTVTNLGGNNSTYTVAVFEYSTNSGAPVYNVATPATNAFAGPGIITSVAVSCTPTNLPVGGVAIAKLTASFSTGQTADESANPLTTWSAGDTTIVQVNSDGTVNGITNGSTTVTGTFGALNGTVNVTVASPAFTDSFTNNHDYVANGLAGTPWDGLFLNFGDVPGANAGPDNVNGQTLTMDANLSNTNELSFSGLGGTWRSGGNDGMFLHKIIAGDFQVAVHINAMNTLNFNAAGVMARLFNNPVTGALGGGGGAGGSETHVEWWKIQGTAGALSRRYTINSTHTGLLPQSEQAGLSATDTWLLMQRLNSTNFYFYEKASSTAPWTAVPAAACVIAGAANNAPMEVGLSQEMRQATVGTVQFDNLMIDGPGIGAPAVAPPPPASNVAVTLNNDLSMTFNWVASDGSGNPVRSLLVMRANGPVTAQPTSFIGNNFGGGTWSFGTGPSLGGSNYIVYVTGNPAASTNVSTTVTGLTPGVTYYAAVYTFVGIGATKNFNSVLPPSGASAQAQDGVLQFLQLLPLPKIPLGGLQIVQVIGHYTGGGLLNVSPFATISSANPAIVAVTNGAASGMSAGSTTLTVIYSGQTNTLNATVGSPTFNDEFNVNQDYLANRTVGSRWDGVYLNQGDIPETGFTGQGITLGAGANISSNNVLVVTNQFGGWAGGQNDGFFLFKYVPGDFQAVVHVLGYDISAYNEAGILARIYTTGTNGADLGAPFALGITTNSAGNTNVFNGETWVGFTKFDEFNIGTYGRKNIDNDEFQFGQNNQNTTDNWLLLLRQQDTNFFFYERTTNTEPWRLTPGKIAFSGLTALPDFAGRPMQVGIQVTPYTGGPPGAPLSATFEHFMLDLESGLPLQYSVSGGNINLSWGPDPNSKLLSSPSLSSPNWQPVAGTPVMGINGFSLSVPIGPGNQFFRLAN